MKDIKKIITLTSLLLGGDLVSKYFFYNQNFLSNLDIIQATLNFGISRGIHIDKTIIIGVSILAIGLFIYLFKKKQISRIIFSILMAGSLGNLIDRLFLGGVRDFISISNFPIFNIADILLNVGIIMILIKEFYKKS